MGLKGLNILANGNYGLQSNRVTYIHLSAFSASGAMVPAPMSDVYTVEASGTFAASLHFSMDVMPADSPEYAGDLAVKCTPMVVQSAADNGGGNIGLVVTDSAGLTQALTKNFDIVPDLTPVSVGLDTSTTAVFSQPTPTNPGP